MKKNKNKLIVILGPTASGKSEIAVKLALRLNSGQAKKIFGRNGAEIISADSRQVYKGMDIGTGKITPDTTNASHLTTGQAKKKYIFTHKGIPHYCIDVVSPKKRFSVVQYRNLALKAINKIFEKGKIPIICGGTGFYIQALIDGIIIPEVKPDWRLRKRLEKKTTEALFKQLKKLDLKRAKTIDRKNRRRLIRALEIIIKTKKTVPILSKKPLPYPILIIGVKKEKEELKKLIERRLLKRFNQGMIAEVKKLNKSGVSWKKMEEFGLEYRQIARYLQEKISYQEMAERLKKEIENYAKRQMTWFTRQNFAEQNLGGFKRDKRINWIKKQLEAEKITKKFLVK